MSVNHPKIGERSTKSGSSTVSAEANIRVANVMPEPKHKNHAGTTGMSAHFFNPAVSAKTNLRKQVKPQRGGRSQNRRIARGLPV